MDNRLFERTTNSIHIWTIYRGITRKSKRRNLRFQRTNLQIQKSDLPDDCIIAIGNMLQKNNWVIDGLGLQPTNNIDK
jgi:hypothetical protein